MKNTFLVLLMRLITAAAFGLFLWRAYHQWQAAPTLTLSLVIVGELITLTIYLTARLAKQSTFGLLAITSTICATFFFYLVVLEQGIVLAPLWLTASLQILGILWQIVSKLSLGRSFGLLPANRGIVTRGTYKVVRHPIYLGYLISHLGFLFASFNWTNALLFSFLYFFQSLRIFEEEKLLKQDPSYRDYIKQTRYRLIPGII